jgi:UDP-glucose 4-epimerase
MKIAITGGAGFVGSYLTTAFLDAGHDLFVIDSLVNCPDPCINSLDPRARFYHLDIRDERLHKILQMERPDVVSHHAGQPAQPFYGDRAMRDADVHIRGLLNVLDACVSASVGKFIFASNGNSLYRAMPLSEYAQQDYPALKEDAPLCPQRPGDISKVAGEWYVRYYTRAFALDHTILRYADIVGAAESIERHPVLYFATMLADQQRPIIRGSGQDMRDHVFLEDVARANLLALDAGRNSTLHVSSGHGYSPDTIFCAVAQHLASSLLPVYLSTEQAEPTAIVLDNTLAHRQLGWQPQVGFTDGIRRIVEATLAHRTPTHEQESREPVTERVEAAVLV